VIIRKIYSQVGSMTYLCYEEYETKQQQQKKSVIMIKMKTRMEIMGAKKETALSQIQKEYSEWNFVALRCKKTHIRFCTYHELKHCFRRDVHIAVVIMPTPSSYYFVLI
jgi:hypothetical protein